MRVLVVDDEVENLRLVARMMQLRKDDVVETADSGGIALAKAAHAAYDVILLDISMPEMDGIQTLGRLRQLENARHTKVVACTAHASGSSRAEFLNQGFSGVLTKPFLLEELYSALGVD